MAIVDRRGGTLSALAPPLPNELDPGIAIKAPVRVTTTGANLSLSGLTTIDGVQLGPLDRVLVMHQTDPTQNGIYVAATGAWSRAVDADGSDDLAQGMLVEVAQGAFNGGALFELATPPPITLGTSQLIFQSASAPVAIEPIFDGGNVPLTTAFEIQHEVGSRTTLRRWTLLADRSGSIVIDVRRGSFNQLPLSSGNSICGGAQPTLAAAQFAQSAGLSAWQTGLNAGDILVFSILSVSLVQEVTLSLYGTRP